MSEVIHDDVALWTWDGLGMDGGRHHDVIFWALVVALVKAVTNRNGSSESRSVEAPMEILRRRYVAGEVTKEQFEAMKKDVA